MTDIAIATSTSYKLDSESNKVRAVLAQKLIENAVAKGYLVFVVDDNSPAEFVNKCKQLGAEVHAQQGKSIGASRREAIKLAYDSGRKIICLIEPEKAPLIPELEKAIEPVQTGEADWVVPERTRQSWESYPTIQYHQEMFCNLFVARRIRSYYDIFFGPQAFCREIADYFLRYDDKYGGKWDAFMVPFIDALCDGKKVISVPVNYTHPPEQTRLEEKDTSFDEKRKHQLNLNLDAIVGRLKERGRIA